MKWCGILIRAVYGSVLDPTVGFWFSEPNRLGFLSVLFLGFWSRFWRFFGFLGSTHILMGSRLKPVGFNPFSRNAQNHHILKLWLIYKLLCNCVVVSFPIDL